MYFHSLKHSLPSHQMFSGMFTHLIKPALTLQQAKELFGLLGYQPSIPNEDEELALNSKPAPSDFLLGLACGFFTARMECQLLLSSLCSAPRGVEWVLQLVNERQAGHSLQVALENAKRKSEVARASDAILTSGMDTELDLYTEETDVTSTPLSPPHSSYKQPKEIVQSKPLQKEPLQSDTDMRNNDVARQGRSINNSGPMESFDEDQSKGGARRQAAVNVMCSCITPDSLYIYQCEKCKDVHCPSCSRYKECIFKEHTLALCPYNAEDLYLAQDQLRLAKEKDSMKTHSCMVNSTSDTFLVCYNCQVIHDHNCNIIQKCKLNHNVLPTGKLQPPQGERVHAQKRHTCLSSEASVYIICHTCNNSHDLLCQDWQNCVKRAHSMKYHQETGASEAPPAPTPFLNHCLTDKQPLPDIVCLTCKALHFSGCPGGRHCSQKHKIQDIGTKCITCFGSELYTYCRYCGALYCKRCCFKNAMVCKCGMSVVSSSSV